MDTSRGEPIVRREWAKRLTLLAVTLGLGLVVLELAARLMEPREVLRSYFETRDPILNHKFIPGAHGYQKTTEYSAYYAINSLGLRDRELTRQKPAGTRRILVLGDSFTEGNGVQAAETASSVLQEKVDASGLKTRWEVINAGVGSYSPLLEYLYLKTAGLDLQPDVVVLNFDLSDIYDDVQYTRLARFDERGDPVAVTADPQAPRSRLVASLVRLRDFVRDHFRIYNFLARRIPTLLVKPETSGDIQVDKYAMLRDNYRGHRDAGWELSYRYLVDIQDTLKAHGIEFLVTVYPYGNQVSPNEWGTGRRYWGFEAGRVYSTAPQEWITDFCHAHGIEVVNMCDDFRSAARTASGLYFDRDGHWRPAGHQIAAAILYRALLPHLYRYEPSRASEPAAASAPLPPSGNGR
jgi:hypothetical protein